MSDFLPALERALGLRVENLTRLSGGASQETWSFDATGNGETLPLILRRAPGGVRVIPEGSTSVPLSTEAAVIEASRAAGCARAARALCAEGRGRRGPGLCDGPAAGRNHRAQDPARRGVRLRSPEARPPMRRDPRAHPQGRHRAVARAASRGRRAHAIARLSRHLRCVRLSASGLRAGVPMAGAAHGRRRAAGRWCMAISGTATC